MVNNIEKVFMDPRGIERIRTLIHTRLGINIKEGKESLLRQRLWKLIQNGDFKDLHDICNHVESSSDSNLLLKLATLISTNHTYFFREVAHFTYIQKNVLPHLVQDEGRIRFWSAASSSGEEVYTLCMILADAMGLDRFTKEIAILGTDISQRVLKVAEEGIYSNENLEQIPSTMKLNYTEPAGKDTFKVIKAFREACLFRRLNLNIGRYPFKKKFHVILCRNVFIYFDIQTQEKICHEFSRISMPDSWLFISQTETLRNLDVPWKYIRPGIYKKK